MYHPRTGEVGTELVNIADVKSAPEQRSVDLLIPDLRPVNQLHLKLSIRDHEGKPFEEDLYWTIHNIPGKTPAAKKQTEKKCA